MWIFIAIFSLLVTFITLDLVRSKKRSAVPESPFTIHIESETKKVVQLDAEVDRKLEELRAHMDVETGVAPDTARDPNSETRCMKAIREKVEKVEQLKYLPHRRNSNV